MSSNQIRHQSLNCSNLLLVMGRPSRSEQLGICSSSNLGPGHAIGYDFALNDKPPSFFLFIENNNLVSVPLFCISMGGEDEGGISTCWCQNIEPLVLVEGVTFFPVVCFQNRPESPPSGMSIPLTHQRFLCHPQ